MLSHLELTWVGLHDYVLGGSYPDTRERDVTLEYIDSNDSLPLDHEREPFDLALGLSVPAASAHGAGREGRSGQRSAACDKAFGVTSGRLPETLRY